MLTFLYLQLANAEKSKKTMTGDMEQDRNELEEEKFYRVKLYTYPDWKNPISIFEDDEL